MKNLTIEEKYNAIQMVEREKKKPIEVAKTFGCGKTQIYEALKGKRKIIDDYEKNRNLSKKKARISNFDAVNKTLYDWFCIIRAKNLPLSGPMLKEKAMDIAKRMNITNFNASSGWLDSFKANYQISFQSVAGEANGVDINVVEKWKESLASKIEKYDLKDIANADETGLFYKMLPNKSMHMKGEKCHGGKLSKERITVLITVFADGTIMKPLVIGKSRNPRCFKNLKKSNLPVHYYSNSKAWMTVQIFTEYLEDLNQKMLRQGRNILLFLDNASSHPKKRFSNIELVFFPPNCTSRLQPLDAGIIHCLKVYYRQVMLRKVLVLLNNNDNASDVSSKINVLDAIMMISRSAKRITPECIKKCFRNCGFPIENDNYVETSDYDLDDLNNLIRRFESSDNVTELYLNVDNEIGTENNIIDLDYLIHGQNVEDVNIINDGIEITEVIDCVESDGDMESDEELIEPIVIPNINDLTDSLNKLKIFAKIKGNNSMFENIENIENDLNEEILKAVPTKQTTIDDYFSF